MDDEARRIILARRARFVAAALASLGAAGACESEPEVCLSFADAGTGGDNSGGSSGAGQGGTGLVVPPGGSGGNSGTGGNGGEGEGGAGGDDGMAGQGPLPCLPYIEPEE